MKREPSKGFPMLAHESFRVLVFVWTHEGIRAPALGDYIFSLPDHISDQSLTNTPCLHHRWTYYFLFYFWSCLVCQNGRRTKD